jgi:hypothetical protein
VQRHRRYAIVAEQDLREGAAKLTALHESLTTRPTSSKIVSLDSRKAR